MVGEVNVGNTSGGKLNIFCQTTEPKTKEGIWLKTGEKYNNVIIDDKFFLGGTWIDKNLGLYSDIPFDFYIGSCVSIGTDIYLIGSITSGVGTCVYKYNPVLNVYNRINEMPTDGWGSSSTVLNGDIYIFGSANNYYHRKAYKLNPLTQTYVTLPDIPFNFYIGDAVGFEENIYLFGGNGNPTNAYLYNKNTNTYTKLNNIPFSFYNGTACLVGDYIYLFGGSGRATLAYKYSIKNNTYTKIQDIPYQISSGKCVAVGTDIYIAGSVASSQQKNFYKYDINTNTYTKLVDLPINFFGGGMAFVDAKIFLLGGGGGAKYVQAFSLTPKQYDNSTFIIYRSDNLLGKYYTELVTPKKILTGKFPRLTTGFNDVFLYSNSTILSADSYYGNGSSWIKFK